MMSKTAINAFLAMGLVAGGTVYSGPSGSVYYANYRLASEALIMIPVENAEYAQAATNLYLDPLGFEGTTTTLNVPEVVAGADLEQAVAVGVKDLVAAVETEYNSGAIDPSDPLWIFGYSQSAVVASLAEQQLASYGIPTDDLHFVLVGDSASADGGFLNTFGESLPAWLRNILASEMGDVYGATTPDDLYPTDVYSLSGDGWTNWDNGATLAGLFSDHLEYLGLTPAEVSSATLSLTDDLTHYFTIDSADVNGLSALWETLMIAVSVF
jgi:hypothetical protein